MDGDLFFFGGSCNINSVLEIAFSLLDAIDDSHSHSVDSHFFICFAWI